MTQTQIHCHLCGDTGFVPPLMDPCPAHTYASGALGDPTLDPPEVVDFLSAPTLSDEEVAKAVETQRNNRRAHVVAICAEHVQLSDFAVADLRCDEDDEDLFDSDDELHALVQAQIDLDEAYRADATAKTVAAIDKTLKPHRSGDADFDELMDEANALDAEVMFVPEPDYAAGYGEAGIYSDPSISYGPARTSKPITDAQKALLTKLIAERDPTDASVWNAKARLDSGHLTAKSASSVIDALLKIPANPALKPPRPNSYAGTCADCGGPVAEKAGRIEKTTTGYWKTYHLVGGCPSAEDIALALADRVDEPGLYREPDTAASIYRVRKARTSGRLYGEKIAVVDGTVEFLYNGNAMSFLRKSDKLTWKEARDFGALYGCCVACGRSLSDPRSVVAGYGATCAGHHGWPTISNKQAEQIIAGTVTWEEVTGLRV